jgi:hypothetical protein
MVSTLATGITALVKNRMHHAVLQDVRLADNRQNGGRRTGELDYIYSFSKSGVALTVSNWIPEGILSDRSLSLHGFEALPKPQENDREHDICEL